MRHAWGMGVGHTYSWKGCAPHSSAQPFHPEISESQLEPQAEDEGQECNNVQDGSGEQEAEGHDEDELESMDSESEPNDDNSEPEDGEMWFDDDDDERSMGEETYADMYDY